MASRALPLVPHVSQFDGGSLAAGNCAMAAGARLLRYATDRQTTGSDLRTCQSDQEGGTSIPDVVRALIKCHGFTPSWAAPNDPAPEDPKPPPGRIASFIPWTRLDQLLDEGQMVVLLVKYMTFPAEFREQTKPVKDHAITLDAKDPERGYYVVDPIPRASSGYRGRFIPAVHVKAAAEGMAGKDRALAAWARPSQMADEPSANASSAPRLIGFTPTGSPIGTATVKGDGHFAFDLARSFTKLARGQRLPVIVAGRLSEAINAPEQGERRQLVFAVELDGRTLWVLQMDVEFEPGSGQASG